MIGYEKFLKEEKPKLQAEGKHVGIGVVTYIEGTGIGPYEGARVTVESNGKVNLATGVGTQGQGHYTIFAQIAAEQLGVEASDVRVVTGDTRLFNWGTGTFASRGAVVAGNACFAAAKAVREKIFKLASAIFEVPSDELILANGKIAVKGIPKKAMTLGELALRANPLRGAVARARNPVWKLRRISGLRAVRRQAACTP
jgi:CO/xanthine dehydrogenase Mo-binding subunit